MFDKLTIRFEIKYILVIIGLVFTFVFSAGYLFVPEEHTDAYLKFLTIIAIGIGLSGYLYRVTEVHALNAYRNETTRIEKIKNASKIISEWHSPTMADMISNGRRTIKELKGQNASEITKYLDSSPEDKKAVISILNYLEQIALMVDLGLVDDECAKRFFSVIVPEYYYSLLEYIKSERINHKDESLFCDLEALNKRWSGTDTSTIVDKT